MVIAALFGSGLAADAFFVAFRIPNLLRRLFAEGSLTISFIPVFTEYLTLRTKKEAFELASVVLTILSTLLAVITLLGILFSPWIVRVQAFGFGGVGMKYELTVLLTRIMFPYIFFIGLAALVQAMLNSHGSFAVPAATPIFLNLAIIGCAFGLRDRFESPATAFAVGVLVGGSVQLAMQLPALWRLGFRLRWRHGLRHPANWQVLRLMVPGIFGAGIYQINVAVSQAMASAQQAGAVSSLQYSSRILELILGIFVVSLATVVLPQLSRHAAAGEYDAMADTGVYALSMMAFLPVPATVGTILLRGPIVDVLFRFKGGTFDDVSSGLTQAALAAHMLGLFFIGGVRVMVNLFFALKDTRTPVIAAAVSMVANVALCVTLPWWMAHAGIAMANSVAAALQLVLLGILLRPKLPHLAVAAVVGPLGRIGLCSAIMGVVCHGAAERLVPAVEAGKLAHAAGVAGTIAVAVVTYAVASRLTRSPELGELTGLIRKKLGRGNHAS